MGGKSEFRRAIVILLISTSVILTHTHTHTHTHTQTYTQRTPLSAVKNSSSCHCRLLKVGLKARSSVGHNVMQPLGAAHVVDCLYLPQDLLVMPGYGNWPYMMML